MKPTNHVIFQESKDALLRIADVLEKMYVMIEKSAAEDQAIADANAQAMAEEEEKDRIKMQVMDREI